MVTPCFIYHMGRAISLPTGTFHIISDYEGTDIPSIIIPGLPGTLQVVCDTDVYFQF